MNVKHTSVAIVGAGPVGLSLACLLRMQGVDAQIYERRADLHRDPQAHVINTRTMEVFREIGVAGAVAEVAAPLEKMRFITWRESLAGRELGHISLLEVGDPIRRLSLSPTVIVNLAQNKLEPVLLKRLEELGGAVQFAHEVVGVKTLDDRSILSLRSPDGDIEIEAQFVVACDGAGSGLRRQAGIEMHGPASLQKFITIYFTANLDRFLGGRPGPLQWIVGEQVRGVLIGFDLARTWALMCPYDEPDRPEHFTIDVAEAMVAKAIGRPDIPFEISSVSNWNMSAQVASSYRSGRLFLAGDAAHRFPPSGGLGMNTGIQDAHNLAWKLSAVVKGWAEPAILDTYEEERRGIAVTNCGQSLENSSRMLAIDGVLDFQTMAPVRPADVLEPQRAPRDWGLSGDTAGSLERQKKLARVIEEQVEHFDFEGLDLGVCYESGALLSSDEPRPVQSVRAYTPSIAPGARLPHAWLQVNGRRRSTHDLCRPDTFTLLVDVADEGCASMAIDAAQRTGVPVRTVRIGIGGDAEDPKGEFSRATGGLQGRPVLVRPDGHVAWSARLSEAGLDAQALSVVLRRLSRQSA